MNAEKSCDRNIEAQITDKLIILIFAAFLSQSASILPTLSGNAVFYSTPVSPCRFVYVIRLKGNLTVEKTAILRYNKLQKR